MTKQENRSPQVEFKLEDLVGEFFKVFQDVITDVPKARTPPYSPEAVPGDGRMSGKAFIRDIIGAVMNGTARDFRDLPGQISVGSIEPVFESLWQKTLLTGKEHAQCLFVKESVDSHKLSTGPVMVGSNVSVRADVEYRSDKPPVLDVHTHPKHATFRGPGNDGLHFSEADFRSMLKLEGGLVSVVISQEQRILAMKSKETLEILAGMTPQEAAKKIDLVFNPFTPGARMSSHSELMAAVHRICKYFKLGLYISGPENKALYVRVPNI